MAISRMQEPRQQYGLGSFVKKITKKATKPFTKIAKKLVPKEIAGIMRVAAPFLPPGYREAAYLLSTAKQTGRISPIDLALASAPTFFGKTNLGQGIAQRVGDFRLPGMERNLRQLMVGTPEITSVRPTLKEGIISGDAVAGIGDTGIATETIGRFPVFEKGKTVEATSGLFGKGGEMFKFGKGDVGILDTKAGQTLFGKETDEGFRFSPTKLGSIGISTLSLIRDAKTPDEAGTALAEATGDSEDYERGKLLFSQLPQGIFDIPEQFRLQSKDGGLMRENYAMGSDMKMAEFDLKDYMDEFERVFPEMKEKRGTEEYMDMLEDYFRGLASKNKQGIMTAKEGGRANLALGTMPTAQESGLGGLPIEADMRYTGGFMPYGAKEKADDVPARLSKNEFVFTADAVRAAGGGSVQKGAQRMYNTMKQLESKPEAKGMTA